ncbi:hypothetical protein [Gellertiella hungarica]|uniref:Uncharacterized protein n=1 Tax=Gellertiella hungarica TaxID=1572859 RepID=A0A7W6J850_9HYPH|nr:hypothetical protein [Gellertiella hungarica]
MSNGFAAAFQSVAGFLGRPTSETVLFSGVPFDEQRPTIEEIEQLSTRIGLESQPIPAQQFTRGAFETPLILILNGGGAISLLEETTPGATSPTRRAPTAPLKSSRFPNASRSVRSAPSASRSSMPTAPKRAFPGSPSRSTACTG